jgi:hypothetical protein
MKVPIRLLVLLITALAGIPARSQEIIKHKTHIYHFAPIIGRNVSQLSLDRTEHITGSHAGVAFIYRHRLKHISASVSALYSSRGAQWDRSIRGQYGEVYYWDYYEQLRYIEVPLKLTYIFFSDSGQAFRPKISVGSSFAYLASAKRTSEFEIPEWLTSSEPMTENVLSSYQPFDVGAVASIGFNWEFMHRRWLTVETGYTMGLLDINRQPSITEEVRNSDIFVLVGLEFPLIKQRFK